MYELKSSVKIFWLKIKEAFWHKNCIYIGVR